jgi:hypothetical protein
MLSRALRLPRAVPMRTKLAAPAYTAVRSVTTDAASASLSHSVPKVSSENAQLSVPPGFFGMPSPATSSLPISLRLTANTWDRIVR